MLSERLHPATHAVPRFTLSLARGAEEVREAQRLRYRVFVEEMGARLTSGEPGLDRDIYDPYCDHLLVRDGDSNEVIGTYRVLTAAQARKIGGFYSQNKFDLTRLGHLTENMVEAGRACVHPDYRSGAVIALLWAGLADYMRTHRANYLMGCASISIADGGHAAASTYRQLEGAHLSPVEWRVFPRHRLPVEHLEQNLAVSPPPLIEGYVRVGAYVCGGPAWDPDFNTADLLMLLPMSRLSPRYARHFLGKD